MVDNKELEKRIKVLEEGEGIDVNERIKTCKAISESNSKWYRHQGIVTMSILGLFLAAFSGLSYVVGYLGGKDFIKREVKTSVEKSIKEEAKPIVNNYIKNLDVRMASMGKGIKFNFWYSNGLAEYNNNEYGKAIDFLNRAIKINPENPYAYNLRGAAYGKNNEFKKSLNDFEKSRTLLPDNPLPYTNIAEIYFRQGKKVEAKEEIDKVKKLIAEGKVNEEEIAVAEEEIKKVQKLLE